MTSPSILCKIVPGLFYTDAFHDFTFAPLPKMGLKVQGILDHRKRAETGGVIHYFVKRIEVLEPGFLANKANPRDLIAATGLVILLKLDSNHRF